MSARHQNPVFPYRRAADQDRREAAHHRVIVVGAGPVGLTAAIDLARQGVPVLLLDDDDTVSLGSRAICYAKRALEIWDRLGCARDIVDKGVVWKLGKVFHHDHLVYQFDLLPEAGHRMPAFVNLQQHFLEEALVAHALATDGLDLRWQNRVTAVAPGADNVAVTVETPEGPYDLTCDWLIAADGARSPIRRLLGLDFKGQVFQDHFLITDVVMQAGFPAERWFWFDPPFHPRQSALLHMQADDVWRIDLQLGPDVDPEVEKQPDRVLPRIRAMLGPDAKFEIEWISVYTFQCRRLDRFRHGRVIFVGDAAHQVSPFGARGANSGVQDADNLVWKLKLVLDGAAPDRLLDSYDTERIAAADENILNSTRSTDFITPKTEVSRAFRDAVLSLAGTCPFARRLINSGRLSLPATYRGSPLSTPDRDSFDGAMLPGAPCADAPVTRDGKEGWLLRALGGRFVGLYFAGDGALPASAAAAFAALRKEPVPVETIAVTEGVACGTLPVLVDRDGLVARRYDAQPGTFYLIRPDQHVAARWRSVDAHAIGAALARATGQTAAS
jgi:3-(3-hydroxy-phenyl)propionate hydroxylase